MQRFKRMGYISFRYKFTSHIIEYIASLYITENIQYEIEIFMLDERQNVNLKKKKEMHLKEISVKNLRTLSL